MYNLLMPNECDWRTLLGNALARRGIYRLMKTLALSLIGICALGVSACSREDRDAAERKTGKAAHELAIETKEAAKKADQELKRAAKETREGWHEATSEKDKDKDKR
jgi:hypothetical protein